jgi:hypothetical protein
LISAATWVCGSSPASVPTIRLISFAAMVPGGGQSFAPLRLVEMRRLRPPLAHWRVSHHFEKFFALGFHREQTGSPGNRRSSRDGFDQGENHRLRLISFAVQL